MPERPHRNVVLRVACPDDRTAAIVTGQGKAWAGREGVQLQLQRYTDTAAVPPEADAWIIPPPEMPRWAAEGKILPVPDTRRTGQTWNDLLPSFRDRLLIWDNRAYALPLLGESPLCFYRADLFRSPDSRTAYRMKFGRELSAPNTWEEFADLAEFFTRQLGRPSLPPLPQDDEDLDREFHSLAGPIARRAVSTEEQKASDVETFSFHFDLKTGKPRLETPGFIHAVKLLQRLQACRPAGTHAAPPSAFRDGLAVLCLADASWVARFHECKVPFSVCRVPGSGSYFTYDQGEQVPARGSNRVPYLGSAGWLGVVPVRSAHPEAAFALLAELSSRDTSRQIVLVPEVGGGGVFRGDHLDSPRSWFTFDLGQDQTEALVGCLRQTLIETGIKNPLIRLRTPDQHERLKALMTELRGALRKGAGAEEALAAATRRWHVLDQGRPEALRKQEYLLSLSLHGER